MLPASPVDHHARAVATAFLAGLLAAASLLAACGLEWTVRSEPEDASPVAESGADAADVGVDADAADTSPPVDAPVSPDAGACAALAADLAARKVKARECQIGGGVQCTSTVNDECGCGVIVRSPIGAPTTNYTSAVTAFIAACGAPPVASCTCPQLGVPASWACLQNGSVVACHPP